MQVFESANQIRRRQADLNRAHEEALRMEASREASIAYFCRMALQKCATSLVLPVQGWGVLRSICSSLPQESWGWVVKHLATEEGRQEILRKYGGEWGCNPTATGVLTHGGVMVQDDPDGIWVSFNRACWSSGVLVVRPSFQLFNQLLEGLKKYGVAPVLVNRPDADMLTTAERLVIIRRWVQYDPAAPDGLMTGLLDGVMVPL